MSDVSLWAFVWDFLLFTWSEIDIIKFDMVQLYKNKRKI